jgi:superfamily II RNA helicase
VREVESVYDFPLDGFQQEATRLLIEGHSVVVSAPTGSGKTLIGETAIMTVLARGQKAIYTTPLKALSNQKLREFQALFGTRRVGLKTGDVEINAANADIVVMTTEILRNMLYPSAGDVGAEGTEGSGGAEIGELGGVSDGRLDNVGVVILDEVHYLADVSRGTVWEETIIYCPPRIQLLCLSATVGNPDDLAGWIEEVHCQGTRQRCETIVSDYRPVPLNWHFSMKPGRMWPGLGPLLSRKGDRLNHELFPFTKEGVREWALANGGGDRGGGGGGGWGGDAEWGVNDDQDGSYEGGFYRKARNDGGRRGGAGGARGGGSSSRSRGGGGRGEREGGRGDRNGRGGGDGYNNGGYNGGGGYNRAPPPSPANDRQMRRRLVPHVETTVGQLVAANMLPAVWFIFSRKGCDQAAFYLADCGAKLVTRDEEREIAYALDEFAAINPDAVRPEAVAPLLLGIASHHAGLLPGWKGLVEGLFQRGLLKVVFATETLAAGVNMPARCSVMSALSKRGDSGPRALTSNEFMQMCGRAGRRGYDTVGHVVACQSPFEGPEEAFALVQAPPENLRSQFSISYGMVLNLLRAGKPLRQVRSIVERSFGNYLGGRAKRGQVKELRRLREQADALREQIESGESIVEPEEWARYVKLDGRLKEERRLLKIISRQTEDSLAEVARAAVKEAMELREMPVIVYIETDENDAPQTPERPKPEPSPTVGLMPDGSWSMGAQDGDAEGEKEEARAAVGGDRIGEVFDDDVEEEETADDDDDEGGGGGSARGANANAPRGRVIAVAIVEAYQPPPFKSVGGRNPFPLGEFVALAADGTWHRFAARSGCIVG